MQDDLTSSALQTLLVGGTFILHLLGAGWGWSVSSVYFAAP